MSYCRICGDEKNVRYRPAQGQSLCNSCWQDTPAKVSRESFERAYWKRDDGSDGREDVPESTRREFYADYLASTNTLKDYLASTTSSI
jgi:hypothetical protein